MQSIENILTNSTFYYYSLFDQLNDPLIITSTKILFLVFFNFILLYNWSYLGSVLLKNTINYEGFNSIITMFLYTLWFFTTLKYVSLITNISLLK